MPEAYFPLDVNFFDHPKVVGLDNATLRLYLSSVAYANRFMTDGYVADAIIGRLIDCDWNDPDAMTPDRCAAELERAVLWHRSDAPCPRGHDETCPKLGGAGWRIHDFLEHNRSREMREAIRDKERDRKAEYRRRQREESDGVPSGHDVGQRRDRLGQSPGRTERPPREDRRSVQVVQPSPDTARGYTSEKTVTLSVDNPLTSGNAGVPPDVPHHPMGHVPGNIETETETDTGATAPAAARASRLGRAAGLVLVEPKPELPAETAQTVLGAYIDWRRSRGVNGIDGRTKGMLARQLREAFDGGHPPEIIRLGLADWDASDTHPSTLGSFIDTRARGGQPRASPGKGQRQLDDIQRTYQQMQAMDPPGGGERNGDLATVDRDRRQAQRELP